MAVDLEQVMDVVDVMDLLLGLTLYMLESRVYRPSRVDSQQRLIPYFPEFISIYPTTGIKLNRYFCIDHHSNKMGRNAKASSSKLPTRPAKEGRSIQKAPVPREPESEAESASDDEEVDEDDLLEEVEGEEEEGIAQYAPDDWDGEDDGASDSQTGSGSQEEDGSASESEDDGKEDLVCPLSPLMVKY
jgi:hypothetical protein